jgi:hypothetical protein
LVKKFFLVLALILITGFCIFSYVELSAFAIDVLNQPSDLQVFLGLMISAPLLVVTLALQVTISSRLLERIFPKEIQ